MDTYHKQTINQRSAALLSKQLVQTEPRTVQWWPSGAELTGISLSDSKGSVLVT